MELRELIYIVLTTMLVLVVRWSTYDIEKTDNYHDPQFKQSIRMQGHVTPTTIPELYNSSLYNVSYTSMGVVLRVRHMTKATRRLSTWTVSGEGLHSANVGRRAYIAVKVGNESLPKFQKGNYISLLAVGKNHIFVVKPFRESRTTEGVRIDFMYVPTVSGTYNLFVEEMFSSGQKQISGSPFRLKVDGPPVKPAAKRMESNRKPSCQTINQNDYTWLDGEWVTRTFAGNERGTLRSGWVFQPKLCSFDIFTKEDLALAAVSHSPTTIAILGTSTERGIFLTLIDLALYNNEKLHFDKSDVGKCWGYARVRIGNLTFIYQDCRLYSLGKQKREKITCHDEKLAVPSLMSLEADAAAFMGGFLFKDLRYRPDVILLVLRNSRQLRLMVNQIPSEWEGNIYAVNNFRSKGGVQYTQQGQVTNAREMQLLASIDPRIQIINGFDLGTGMRHATESSPLIMKANHFHRWCNELNGEMRVCGNPTEIAAQMLLGKALAPIGKTSWNHSRSITNSSFRDIEICYDCPESLLPFHLKRKPELECYRSNTGFKIRNESNVKVWDGSLCPQECMETEPVDKFYTQSDTVNVRQCTVST